MSSEPSPAVLEYFKAGKRRTIALIVAGVIAVGGLGAIAALAFGDEDQRPLSPGVEEASDFDPTPVALPGEPGEPGEEPTPTTPTANPTSETGLVTIGDGVEIFVPRTWEVVSKDENRAVLINGRGSLINAFASTASTTDAIGLVPATLDILGLTSDGATNAKYWPPVTMEPKGTVVSAANFDYKYTYADQQRSMKFYGRAFIFTRQDKSVLILGAEHTPAKKWEKGMDAMIPVLEDTYARFAGL